MKRWLPGLLALTLAALVALPSGSGAQGKDTLTVALVSHAPTLDPHMHFERVGILVKEAAPGIPTVGTISPDQVRDYLVASALALAAAERR